MADDPLRQQVMKFLDAQYPHARLADHQFAADALLKIFTKADPLRALLTNEDRAVELIAQAAFDSAFGDGAWSRSHEGWKAAHRRDFRAMLTVLREVAGL